MTKLIKQKTKKNATLSEQFKNLKKIVERGEIDTSNKQIHDCSLSWINTCPSIQSGRVELVFGPKPG
jgi:hypothetical protein